MVKCYNLIMISTIDLNNLAFISGWEISRGWGIRTGRLSREGLKMRVARRDEGNGAAYQIYFSTKRGERGTPEYMADTYKARWLEGGTKPHYTVKGASIKSVKRGKVSLSTRQRKLLTDGFPGRPIIKQVVSTNLQPAVNIFWNNILPVLKKKGAKE